MGFPEKNYDRLQNIWRRWGLSQEDIFYAIENAMLRVCVWLPLRYVERCAIKDQQIVFQQHEMKEGFLGVRPEDFHRICSTGRAKLRVFQSLKIEGNIIRLAYEPPQSALYVRINDLVVRKEDSKRFEQAYEICPQAMAAYKPGPKDFTASPDYRHVILMDEEFQLGDVQASIIQQLHDASMSRNQWVHGKILLNTASSKALRVRDVFKSKSDWQKLIASDGRGYYRLNIAEVKKRVQTAAMFALMCLQDILDFVPDCLMDMCAG